MKRLSALRDLPARETPATSLEQLRVRARARARALAEKAFEIPASRCPDFLDHLRARISA